MSFTGAAFDTVVVSYAFGLAVDHIEIELAAVPEPTSLALLGVGLAIIALARRRGGI